MRNAKSTVTKEVVRQELTYATGFTERVLSVFIEVGAELPKLREGNFIENSQHLFLEAGWNLLIQLQRCMSTIQSIHQGSKE